MIRKASLKDIDDIMDIVKKTIEIMVKENNPQWDKDYPSESDFINDIREESLFIFEEGEAVMGMICINCIEPEEYADISWSKKCLATVVHRMAVSPSSRGKGVGYALIRYADEVAKKNNTFYIKIDTYTTNVKMNPLIIKLDYTIQGQIYIKGINGKFNCYDKIIENNA